MKQFLIALIVVAGCGASDQPEGVGPKREAGSSTARNVPAQPIDPASLTGLYEGGSAPQVNQLCMIGDAGNAQFGLVIWGANMHNCSGAGKAMRQGEGLRLTMAGDETCTIDARLENGQVTLPDTLPAGCSYYCGARARMEDARFTRTGTTQQDAMKAQDLAGEPLCGS